MSEGDNQTISTASAVEMARKALQAYEELKSDHEHFVYGIIEAIVGAQGLGLPGVEALLWEAQALARDEDDDIEQAFADFERTS